MKRFIAITVMTLLLSSCAGMGGGANVARDIDFNADVEAISTGVSKFDENTRQSLNIETYEQFKSISENNGRILEEIDAAIDNFRSNIERASSELPSEDSTKSPSKSKLLAWADGYKTWIYYQKLNQSIGVECLNYPDSWTNCLISRLSETSQNEQASTVQLTIAIQGIQEWRDFAGQ